MELRVQVFGEAALLVELGEEPELGISARVHALARALEAEPPRGLRSLVPGYVSLLVELDPLQADLASVERVLREHAQHIDAVLTPEGRQRQRTIPTVYGGEWGPDLDEVAHRIGLTASEVIARHIAAPQSVYMLGFSPGFPYLGDLPSELALPRRTTPRERVPVGSVAIAGRQTGIYSREMPGGWHLLGRTPVPLFDPARNPPAYLGPGDSVRFEPIDAGEWERFAGPPPDW
ncbi:MAG: 5-oxoprolinase subunit PxpB [Chloroflexota bacterium]|nr:5-oxoprolinase subunit PxpB [Chloroflexota bacterium]